MEKLFTKKPRKLILDGIHCDTNHYRLSSYHDCRRKFTKKYKQIRRLVRPAEFQIFVFYRNRLKKKTWLTNMSNPAFHGSRLTS